MPYLIRAASKPRAGDWWDQGPLIPDLVVDGPQEVDTQLVDLHGNKIMRVQAPIGFGRDEEH